MSSSKQTLQKLPGSRLPIWPQCGLWLKARFSNSQRRGSIPRIALNTAFALALLGLLGACGFHLRGAASLPLQTIFIEQTNAPTAAADVARAIRTGTSTRVSEDRAAAQAILQLSGESTEKRILSLNEAGRVRAFELFYRLTFRLHDGKENDMLPQQQIELRREFTYNDQQILAKEAEESLLYANMRSDAIQQIIRRISAVKPQAQ